MKSLFEVLYPETENPIPVGTKWSFGYGDLVFTYAGRNELGYYVHVWYDEDNNAHTCEDHIWVVEDSFILRD